MNFKEHVDNIFNKIIYYDSKSNIEMQGLKVKLKLASNFLFIILKVVKNLNI